MKGYGGQIPIRVQAMTQLEAGTFIYVVFGISASFELIFFMMQRPALETNHTRRLFLANGLYGKSSTADLDE